VANAVDKAQLRIPAAHFCSINAVPDLSGALAVVH